MNLKFDIMEKQVQDLIEENERLKIEIEELKILIKRTINLLEKGE